jgi:hypothetical protein
MAQLVEYVDELVQEVGPRPAGTQQEHQAAELIAARLDEFGMRVDIEEFSCARNLGWVRALYYALCVGGAAVTIVSPLLRIAGIILIAVGAILMLLDYLGKNPLFSLLKNSLSQNVIARYVPPGAEPSSRSRKVVILAHYDSARAMVQAAPFLALHYAQVRRVVRAAMIALIVLSLLTLVPFPAIALTVLSVIIGIVAAVVLLALLAEIVNFFMPYNQGANCNGSGVGVLYGVAQALSSGVDVAGMRSASAQKNREYAVREEGSERSSRARRGDRGERASRGGSRERGLRGGAGAGAMAGVGVAGAGSTAGAGLRGEGTASMMSGALSRLKGMGKSQAATRAGETNPALELGGPENAESLRSGDFVEREGQPQAELLQPKAVESSVQSIADNLANPFISQRPPLAEIEEANRLREEEQARRLEEQRRQAQAEDHTEDGMPAWFVKAKKAAEQKAERKRHDPNEPGIVRSRFADMPVSGRLQRAENDSVAEEALRDGAADVAAQSAAQVAVQPAAVAAGESAASSAGVAAPTAVPGVATAPATAPAASQQTAAFAGVSAAAPAGTPVNASISTAAGAPAPAAAPAPARTLAPIEHPELIVVSDLAAQGAAVERNAGVEQGAPTAQRQQAETHDVAPMTAKPDFTGLDRQAFRVLPAEKKGGVSLVVPAEAAGIVRDDTIGVKSVVAPAQSDVADTQGVLFTESYERAPLQAPASEHPRNRLRDLPSLSSDGTGNIPIQQATLTTEPVAKEELFSRQDSPVSATGSFVPLGTTGVMKPVGEDLLAYHDDDEIYIADADDTFIAGRYSATGEYSEPDLVNIPDSRVKSFFGSMGDRLSGKKKEKLADSPATWLGVDKSFDARKEGNEIGSWDNFNENDDESWSGGAYGGASYEENVGAMMNLSNELLDKEVWLVALGANESKNAGLANLFAEHGNELKSALFVNLLGVGAGDLVFTVSEGNYRPAQTDHRMQSLISTAAQNMAIPINPVKFSAFSTDCTETLKRGGRAISIMGLGNQVPVGWRWTDDEIPRLREDKLSDTVALVVETIKNS